MTRIARIDAVPLAPLALTHPFATTNAALGDIRPVVIRVRTESGVEGFGEAMPAWEVTGETQETIAAIVGLYGDPGRLDPEDVLVGRSVGSLDDVRALVDRMTPVDRPFTVAGNPSAKAGIEQALIDVVARASGVSSHELLGVDAGVTVPTAGTVGLFPLEQALADVDRWLALGVPVIRLKLGGDVAIGQRSSRERDVEVVREAAAAIRASGQPVVLAADANEGFVDVTRAADFCERVEGELAWLEQPFAGDDILGFAALSRRTSVPLMADESVHGLAHARTLIELGGVAYLNVKIMKTGGVLTALRIVDLAHANGVGVHVGSMLETSLGCSAAHLVAAARPGVVGSTDVGAWTALAADPFGLLRLAADCRVALARPSSAGTGCLPAAVDSAARF